MMRWAGLVAGIALLVLAFAAFTRVADTREGLVAEVITLLAGGAGLSLTIYGLAARAQRSPTSAPAQSVIRSPERAHSPRDLALGAGGVVLSALLLAGLAITGGLWWAALGFLLLLPMLAGSLYLFWRSLKTNP